MSRGCGAGFWGLVPSQEQAQLALPAALVGQAQLQQQVWSQALVSVPSGALLVWGF